MSALLLGAPANAGQVARPGLLGRIAARFRSFWARLTDGRGKRDADADAAGSRTFTITEHAAVPWDGLLLAWAAMVPLIAGTVGIWLLPTDRLVWLARGATLLWGGALLVFFAGVRRGLSFRTPGGPQVAQLATMLWLFCLGIAVLVLLPTPLAPVLMLVGFGVLAVLDLVAADHAQAPLYFLRLRPLQMVVPIAAALSVLLSEVLD
ncbi:DUF3429 domain-containing protein [Rhizosaccharibacter radicis]|uniref:DUF3429 domain-containing protein n=1 Tax=Rhizosaccharibacter radicis TaxID=2782605 RepID=A0ABT1W289_9PROT|nr:DUF3429 domain-containing protein [Acetobacteraceae bacterium KSS12]